MVRVWIGASAAAAVIAVAPAAIATVRMPADATTPTAGFCASESGHVATVTLGGDVPSPRCLDARHGQELRLRNVGRTVTVGWDGRRIRLAHGQSWTLAKPMGSYLAPGDHHIRGGGGEVWMPGHVATPAPTAAG